MTRFIRGRHQVLGAVPGLLLAVLLSGCGIEDASSPARVETRSDSAAGETTFELAGPGGAALVVAVHLNGQGPFSFVLDTGATLTCVDQILADSLELPESAGRIGIGAGIRGSGRMRLVSVDSLRLGVTSAYDLTACAIDLSRLETAGLDVNGLLGLNFLKAFRVTLDFAAGTLRLEEP